MTDTFLLEQTVRFSTVLGYLLPALIVAALSLMMFILPMKSREANGRLRKLRDERIFAFRSETDHEIDMRFVIRQTVVALSPVLAFWVFAGMFLYFGFGAFLVLTIPIQVISAVVSHYLCVLWVDMELSRARFRRLYAMLEILCIVPGALLYVIVVLL